MLSYILYGLFINSAKKELLFLAPFDRYGHYGPERVSDLPKITQEESPFHL